MTDPLDDVIKLRTAIDKVLAQHHLVRKNFNIIPQDDEADPPVPSHVNVFVRIKPEAILSEQQREQLDYDSSFSSLVEGFNNPETDDLLQEQLNEAKQLLEEGWADDEEDS